MATNEQSVTLLRINKRAQVDALNSLGYDLTEGARASEFPNLVSWAAGLLDLTIAANRKSDNRKFFFTLEEWQSLSATEQDLFLLRGIRVRAWAHSFIVAPDNITNKAWGSSRNLGNAYNFASKHDVYEYYDAEDATSVIIDGYSDVTSGSVVGAPAAEAARAYKVFTQERDGLEDDTVWSLPTFAQLTLIYRFRTEIEAIITAVWSSDFKFLNQQYWSSCQWDSGLAYRLDFNIGSGYPENKTQLKCVRPVALN